MEKLKNITIIFLLAVGLLCSVAPAKTTSVLLQEGLYAEEITGDLDAAIKIYEEVISKSKETQRAAAQATYRIGMCFLKKGDKTKAAEYFQQIVSNYHNSKSLVEKATQQLQKILPQHEEHLPWEAMVYIYDKHMEAHKKAKPKGIAVNSHIVGVDEDFIKYPGGILTHETSNKVTAGKEIWLGNFSRAGDVEFFNEQLEPQNIRFSKRETDAIGKYMLLWKADRDMEAGEVRVIAYRSRKTSKLIATDNGYKLGFNNHYGSPVLENFFLVVPLNVSIVEQSREYTTRKKYDMCEIYHWQREVPANTTNKVDVVLGKSEAFIQDYVISVPVDELIKSGKVPAFKTQIYDNTGLDLETGVSVPVMEDWPALCDVAWDNDGGGALMIKPKSSLRFIALGAAENWEEAISTARNSLGVLRTSNSKGMLASQSKFGAVLTSEGNLAVIQIGEHDANKGTIYGWVEKISAAGFGPVVERILQAQTQEDSWIDFDTGRAYAHPVEVVRNGDEKDIIAWARLHGIDAFAAYTISGLASHDMTAVRLNESDWNNLRPSQLAKAISRRDAQIKPVKIDGFDFVKLTSIPGSTFGFKTNQGGVGILQVVDFMENPWRVKIRYKMLQGQEPIPSLSFGSVTEFESKKPTWIDFEGHSAYSGSAAKGKKSVDVKINLGRDVVYLEGEGATFVLIVGQEWDDLTPYEVWNALAQSQREESLVVRQYPTNYAFQTREGRKGLIQVWGPFPARIRYKMLQKEKVKSPIDLSTPEATIKSFVKAVYDDNLEAAGACVSKDGHDYNEFKEMLATESNHPFQAMIKAMDVTVPVEITGKSIKDGKCKLSWYFTLGRVYYFGETKMKKGMHQEFSSYLELVDDKWLIRDI
ncbi:MAG: tetratricopeptide repeat protein [Phycisphaerae bacterium]|nr:tetratricopeptide repeat protein [Phycisphaerae bacterium]NIP54495.1 tetratricopeptide repeat protein [Phycisphaerae bacterium]NIS53349.1 tetratricopeptide repeat protein [Phycisphaerae bacterium]NIU10852.1 tetratricopeptide repeat protein [Phycisphaerae bacterium]NIU58663.1 tetratricopeptide repeat protein [Phycisphaerae bacterium]